jgi:serine/threonine protein kinase
MLTCVGRGGFGRVWKAHHKETKDTVAVKVMSKLKVLNKNGNRSVMNERTILQNLQHSRYLPLTEIRPKNALCLPRQRKPVPLPRLLGRRRPALPDEPEQANVRREPNQ